MYDQLVEACRETETWPLDLLRKQQLNHVLYNYQQRHRPQRGGSLGEGICDSCTSLGLHSEHLERIHSYELFISSWISVSFLE